MKYLLMSINIPTSMLVQLDMDFVTWPVCL